MWELEFFGYMMIFLFVLAIIATVKIHFWPTKYPPPEYVIGTPIIETGIKYYPVLRVACWGSVPIEYFKTRKQAEQFIRKIEGK